MGCACHGRDFGGWLTALQPPPGCAAPPGLRSEERATREGGAVKGEWGGGRGPEASGRHRERETALVQSQPAFRQMRMASMRLRASTLLIALDR